MSHYLRIYKQVLDLSICQEIIDKFEKDDRKHPGNTAAGYQPDIKQCTDLHTSLPGWENYDRTLFKVINLTYNQYCKDCPNIEYAINDYPIIDTGYQIQKYEPNNKDQFDWHIDNNRNCTSRILAAIVYLNTIKEGGETEFKLNDSKPYLIKPEAGTIVWFPPTFQFPHRGKITISGPKYIITTFIVYKPDEN